MSKVTCFRLLWLYCTLKIYRS